MFVSSACVGLTFQKTCYPDEALFFLLPDSFCPVHRFRHWTFSLQVQKSPVPCFPKGRGIRSCYHLMFPKRSHAPAHGVLIIKDPGISNGCQFRHSLLMFSRISPHTFGVQLRDVFRKRCPRASHQPAAFCAEQVRSLLVPFIAFLIIYRMFKSGYMAHYMEIPWLCQARVHIIFLPFLIFRLIK